MADLGLSFDPSSVEILNGNLGVAIRMARAGMRVFPCDWKPKRDNPDSPSKMPLVKWKDDASDDPATIFDWWTRWPLALVGFHVGAHGLIVIDCDRHGGPDGVAAFQELADAHGLPDGVPIVETLSGGRHYYFAQPAPAGTGRLGNSKGRLPDGIDVRGVGGFVIAPDVEWRESRYEPATGDLVEAWASGSVPELPAWLVELLKPEEAPEASAPRQTPFVRSKAGAREETYAREALEDECREVSYTGIGGRNNRLNEAAFSVGTMVGAGWLSRGEAERALYEAAQACGLKKFESSMTIRSGLNAGVKKPRAPLDEFEASSVFHDPKPRSTIVVGGVTADAETGEICAEIAQKPAPPVKPWRRKGGEPPALGADWIAGVDVTRCPGLVGRVAEWIVASAEFQQPLLAIGAALAIVGTAAARHLGGPTRSGTHLYVIGVAATGSGKDHPLKSIGRILLASKMSHLLGPDKFTAESAINNAVMRSPACVAAVDEFGAFLARGKNRQASTHEQGISSRLRTLWGSSFDAVATTERAAEKFKIIYSPALSIYGTSTAEELYDALSDADTRNGLLNRFLILENPKRPERTKPTQDRSAVPGDIVDGLNAIYFRLGDMTTYHGSGDIDPGAPAIMPWRDTEAEALYDRLQRDITARMDSDTESERYLVRTAEMALRIATIRAVGINARDPRISYDDLQWGAALAISSANTMIEGARDRIAETYWEKSVSRVVLQMKKLKRFDVRDIQQATKLRGKEVKEIFADLVEQGRVVAIELDDRRSKERKVRKFEFVK